MFHVKSSPPIFRVSLLVFLATISLLVAPAEAHHVLGRPSYSLNEDSNTPPSMQMEVQIGNYMATVMAFPAFPKPKQTGRIHLHAAHLDNGVPYSGTVTFKIREDAWFGGHETVLGSQQADGNLYRQSFVISHAGHFVVTVLFAADGEPYAIDFPLTIGSPGHSLPLILAGGVMAVVLGGVAWLKKRRRQHFRS